MGFPFLSGSGLRRDFAGFGFESARSNRLNVRRALVLAVLTFMVVGTFSRCAEGQTPAITGEWTWMGGSSTVTPAIGGYGRPGIYGILGEASAANVPGGRGSAVSWTDAAGNFWLFGGGGVDATGTYGYLNDLWESNPSTNEWTWISGSSTVPTRPPNGMLTGQPGVYGTMGIPAAGNTPGGRQGSVSWIDSSGKLWLFGGYTFDSNGTEGHLNDLWVFDPNSREWAWMQGSNTAPPSGTVPATIGAQGSFTSGSNPGGLSPSVTWVDQKGHVWMFGGDGVDGAGKTGIMNVLWEFDPSTMEWAWIDGTTTVPPDIDGNPTTTAGVYGTLGVPSPSNVPGSRDGAVGWTDQSGNLWLFGGSVIWGTGSSYLGGLYPISFNDLWVFNPTTLEWTWMGGNSVSVGSCVPSCSWPGSYGTLNVPSATNTPGSRGYSDIWTDKAGKVWLFGGGGYDSAGTGGNLNDLWRFDPSLNEWTWMGGNDIISSDGNAGIYGTLGLASPSNLPGGRQISAAWIRSDGSLWLFGGQGADAMNSDVGSGPRLNDLWQFQPNLNVTAAATPTFSVASGTYLSAQTVTISDTTTGATIYYTTDGSAPSMSSTAYAGAITVSATETIQAVAVANGYAVSALAAALYVITPPAATPTFSPAAGTYSSEQMVTISTTTPNINIFYTTDGTTPSSSSTFYQTPIPVPASVTIKAIGLADPATPNYSNSAVASATYTIGPPPSFGLAANPVALTVDSGGAGTATMTVTPANGFNSAVSFACTGLPSGASCTFNPSTVTPSGAAVSTQLTIATPAQSAALRTGSRPFLPATALTLAVCVFGFRRRRAVQFLLLLVAAVAFSTIAGCAAKAGTPPPTPVTSTVTVTATSGSLQQSATIALTVN